MSRPPVYHDGRLLDEREVCLSPRDAGLLHGEGLFETLGVIEGRPLDVEAHLDRLLAGMEQLRLRVPESRSELGDAIRAVAAAAVWPHARLRLTVTAGAPQAEATRLICIDRYEPPAGAHGTGGVAIVTSRAVGIRADDPTRRLKSTSYLPERLALAEARAAEAFEALLLNEHGRLAEGSRTSVVVALGGKLVTPALSEGCLAGTVRRRLLEAGALHEGTVAAADLAEAEEVLLLNSLVGVLAAASIDGRRLAPSASAPGLYRTWWESVT